MEFMLDTIDLEEIQEGVAYMPIVGVTCNPTVVKATSPKDFYAHMREIRKIIGKERSLHIQVIADKAEEMVKEAHKIHEEIDNEVYIKVPVSFEGIKAIKMLKEEGCHVTATAVYTTMQAYFALSSGADYIAPYVNRIGNLGGDPFQLIEDVQYKIDSEGYNCKIVAASFHALNQVEQAFASGAESVTAPYSILKTVFNNPSIAKATKDFASDWYSLYGDKKGLLDL